MSRRNHRCVVVVFRHIQRINIPTLRLESDVEIMGLPSLHPMGILFGLSNKLRHKLMLD